MRDAHAVHVLERAAQLCSDTEELRRGESLCDWSLYASVQRGALVVGWKHHVTSPRLMRLMRVPRG